MKSRNIEVTMKDIEQANSPTTKKGTCYLHSSCDDCPDNDFAHCLLMANGLTESEIEHKPPVVDDITVKHTVLDSINAKLQRIDQSLIGIQINQGKTIREAELEEHIEKLEKQLNGIRPHYSKTLLTADRTELTAAIYKKDDLFPDTDAPSLEKYGIAFAEWLIPSTSTPFRKGIIKKILEYEDLELVDNSRKKIYQCGESNSYKSIKVGVASHGEMTTTVRTNMQEIANGNGQLDQYGYMFGKWIKKNADSYFLSGLFKALSKRG